MRAQAISVVGVTVSPTTKTDHGHACGDPGLNSRYAVLDNQTAWWMNPHTMSRVQEQIRRRFAALYAARAKEMWLEAVEQSDNPETGANPIGNPARGHAQPHAKFSKRLEHAWSGDQGGLATSIYHRTNTGLEIRG